MANGSNSVDMTEIELQLKRLAAQNIQVRNKALKKGAEHIRQQLERNTPIGRNNSMTHKHMKEHTTITNPNADGEIAIGFEKAVSWRVHFAELGTAKQPPQAFIQRTLAQTKEEFNRIVSEELRKGFGM